MIISPSQDETPVSDVEDVEPTQETSYPNIWYVPDPISPKASEEELKTNKIGLHTMAQEFMEVYKHIEIKGENIWTEFISSFRPQTIIRWKLPYLTTWPIFLIKIDVYLKKGRRMEKAQALVYIFYRDRHVCMEEKQE